MTERRSIMVVDDDLDFLEIISRILQSKGYEAHTAKSGSDAIASASQRFYNVAILDISLPDTPGTEVLSALLKIHPEIVAIMLTGHSSVQSAMQSLNRGAFAYLEKPVAPDHLFSIIAQGLEKQRLVRENHRLIKELEQRNREAGILLGVSRVVSQSLDLDEIIKSALDKVSQSLDVNIGLVYLVKNGVFALKAYRGLSEDEIAGIKFIQGADHVHQAIPNVTEASEGHADPIVRAMAQQGQDSYACVPLIAQGEDIGFIGVSSRQSGRFGSRDIELLSAISREISIAVRNAQLYEEASSARALRELDTLRTELLANVSHELRTPLAVIKGSASSLLQRDVQFDEETWREFVESIDKDADRLNSLVDELLTMSRLEAGALELKKRKCRLATLLVSLRDRLITLTLKHNLELSIPQDLPEMNIDEDRIGQVITNLVENGVKYSEAGTKIRIEASSNGKEVLVSVKDEGLGIPKELHGKVFERFFQVGSSTGGPRKGTGLGLTICRGIVEAHGGTIWLESELGKGSKFCFSIPVM